MMPGEEPNEHLIGLLLLLLIVASIDLIVRLVPDTWSYARVPPR